MCAFQSPSQLESIPHRTNDLPYSVHTCTYTHTSGDTIYLHWHPEAEFLYLVQGTLYVMVEQEEILLHGGEAMFIPPNRLHRARSIKEESGTYQALVLAPSLIAVPFSQPQFQKYVQPVWDNEVSYCHLSPEVGWQKEILFYLARLFSMTGEGEEDGGLAVTGFSMIIWQLLYRHHICRFRQDFARQRERERLNERLEAAVSHIHCHYGADISLGDLANLVHLSESQFCRSFKCLTGMSPFAYLNRYRIMQSCLLLKQTDKKVSEIGTLCGFNTVSYFNREFLKIVHMTPSAYRRTAGEET